MCVSKHPTLCTVVRNADSEQPQLARISNLDLSSHMHMVQIAGAEDSAERLVQRLLERAHNEALTEYETRPQWRVYVAPVSDRSSSSVTAFHMAFACSHALADGISGLLFHKTFLKAFKDAQQLGDGTNILAETSLPRSLPPPLEQAGSFPISWSFLLGPLLNEYLPRTLFKALGLDRSPEDAWIGAHTRPGRSTLAPLLPTAVRVALVPPSVLEKVLAACRGHDVRLTGLLNHLIGRALANVLQSRSQSHTHFVVETAIDLRRCLPGTEASMANYVSAVTETISVQADDAERDSTPGTMNVDWEGMQRMTKKLAKASSTLSDQPVALLKYVSNIREWTMKNAAKPANSSFSMSNLGVFDGHLNNDTSDKSEWRIVDMIFSQSADGVGAPLNVNVASARGGSLALTITWWPGQLGVQDEEGFVEAVCGETLRQLERL